MAFFPNLSTSPGNHNKLHVAGKVARALLCVRLYSREVPLASNRGKRAMLTNAASWDANLLFATRYHKCPSTIKTLSKGLPAIGLARGSTRVNTARDGPVRKILAPQTKINVIRGV